MNIHDKINYIIDNDGSEGTDGFFGLQSFLKYVCSQELEDQILELIKDHVDDFYEATVEEQAIANEKPQAVLVSDGEGDWEGLYLDGKLVAQNHSILIQDIPWDKFGYDFYRQEKVIEDKLPEWLSML